MRPLDKFDIDQVTYAAVITIKLPNTEEPLELRVTLTPVDPVVVKGGSIKALQDCTLAELQRFADAVEASVWEQYQDATLVDLAIDGQVEISVAPDDKGKVTESPPEPWLDHAVVLPDSAKQELLEALAEVEPEPPAQAEEGDRALKESERQDIAAELPQHTDVEESATTEEERSLAAVEEEESAEPVPEQVDELPEPLVSVAESEPVVEERETRPLEGEPGLLEVPVRPRVRILGRRRPLGHSTWTAVDILINESAFRDAQAHAVSSLDREVAGVLIGPPPEKQPDGRYVVHVSDTIIARHTRMHGASVTYTPESWRYVNDRLADLYPDDTAVIVGWYHTHPGFGIFLSSMDQFIHQNFFTQIWHVALVLDPQAQRSGFFCWNRGHTQVDAYEFPWPDWASRSW